MNAAATLVTEGGRVGEIAGEIREAGVMYFDLEFVSEARFIPELALLQVSWGDAEEPSTAMVDCLAADPRPLFDVIEAAEVPVVAHAATQDLALLATRFGVRAQGFRDTQIAAAFVGVGDQIGYGNLIKELLAIKLDKGAQFTDWLKRPLSDKQLRYALADVLYLPRAWAELETRLSERGRLDWVDEESELLAASQTGLGPSEDAYKTVKGWRALDPRQLGALRALASWRQNLAVQKNKPLGWILPDKAMVELCRKRAKSDRDLRAVRGIGDGTVRRYGKLILEQLRDGAADPIEREGEGPPTQLSPRGQVWAAVVANLIQSRCIDEGIAPRFGGTRSDAEALVGWFEAGADPADADSPLLVGWRKEMLGDDLLAFLRGEKAVVASADGAPLGLRDV